jgi:hypothetical protein
MRELSMFLKVAVTAFAVSALAAAQTPDTRWFTDARADADTFEISTAEELAGLAKAVNDGNDFRGKTVVLVNDIDLTDWGGWTTIGTVIVADNPSVSNDVVIPFSGTFDGNGKIVKRLTI